MTFARYLPRFRNAQRSLEELAAREMWSASQMQQWQLERLNQLWSHASQHVPYYVELAKSNSLPPRFNSLEQYIAQMPLLAKETVRKCADEFVSRMAGRGRWRKTSGSTGTPMRFFASDATHQAALRYQYRFRQTWDLEIFDRAAFFGAGVARSARGIDGLIRRVRETVTDRLRNRIRLPVHEMSRDELANQLQRLAQFGPAYLYGYSRAIHLLALEVQSRGFQCDAMRVVMMTSEPASAHMIAAVERAFAVPAVIEYGSTETGVTAYEWRDRKLRVRSDRVLMETLPRPDGRYDIVKTLLDNFDFPLLRYCIGDVTDAPLAATDEAFAVLKNIAGRNDDVVYTSAGAAVHPSEIDGIFETTHAATVRRYRLHQSASGGVHVQVEPLNSTQIDISALSAAIARVLPGCNVTIEVVSHVPQTASGKHRLITSEYVPR